MVTAIFATTGNAHDATNQAEFVARGSVEQSANVTLSAAQLFKLADEARVAAEFGITLAF